mgnify:CR=1 FL=1
MKSTRSFLLVSFLLFAALPLAHAHAATKSVAKTVVAPASKLEVGGWIPYWRTATGTLDVAPHLADMTEVSPFVYTLKNDGSLYDSGKLTQEPWVSFIAKAKQNNVRVVPTIMSGNGAFIHALLSDTTSRIALEDAVAAEVKNKNFDGIDIDFEGKKVETKAYFSLFLKGLKQRLGKKWLYCSIEPRTPIDSRYTSTPPADAGQYANDYVAINKYCDRVEIMTYDQGSIDVILNKARAAPYVPVADPAWAEKVLTLAAQTISKKKILLGIATYGYEYSVKPLSEYGYRYDLQWAFNPRYATELAAGLGITPVRNSAGELSFIYKPTANTPASSNNASDLTATTVAVGNNKSLPSTVYSQAAIAAQFQPPFNIVWWSDAQAIKDKVALAQKLGLRGVAVFKFDGGEDQGLWSVLPKGAK